MPLRQTRARPQARARPYQKTQPAGGKQHDVLVPHASGDTQEQSGKGGRLPFPVPRHDPIAAIAPIVSARLTACGQMPIAYSIV